MTERNYSLPSRRAAGLLTAVCRQVGQQSQKRTQMQHARTAWLKKAVAIRNRRLACWRSRQHVGLVFIAVTVLTYGALMGFLAFRR